MRIRVTISERKDTVYPVDNSVLKTLTILLLYHKFGYVPDSRLKAFADAAASHFNRYGVSVNVFLRMVDLVIIDSIDARESLINFINALFRGKSLMFSDPLMPDKYHGLLRSIFRAFNGDEDAFDIIRKSTDLIGDRSIHRMLNPAIIDTDVSKLTTLNAMLVRLVDSVGIKPYDMNRVLEEKALSTVDKEILDQILNTHKKLVDLYINIITDKLISENKKYMSVSDVRRFIRSKGIVVHNLPDGFVGNVGVGGILFTTDLSKMVVHPKSRVTMNPNYNGVNHVCTSIEDGEVVKYYSKTGKPKTATFELRKFLNKARILEETINKDLKYITTKNNCIAHILWLLIATGGVLQPRKNPIDTSIGLISIGAEHVAFDGNGMSIKYMGNDGLVIHRIQALDQQHVSYISNIRKLANIRKSGPILRTDDVVTVTDIRDYVLSVCGWDDMANVRMIRPTRISNSVVEASVRLGSISRKNVDSLVKDNLETVLRVFNEHYNRKPYQYNTVDSIRDLVHKKSLLQYYDVSGNSPPEWLSI